MAVLGVVGFVCLFVFLFCVCVFLISANLLTSFEYFSAPLFSVSLNYTADLDVSV